MARSAALQVLHSEQPELISVVLQAFNLEETARNHETDDFFLYLRDIQKQKGLKLIRQSAQILMKSDGKIWYSWHSIVAIAAVFFFDDLPLNSQC